MSRSEAEGHQMWWCAVVLVLLIAACLVLVAVESVDVSGQTGHWITGATFYKVVVGAEETKRKANLHSQLGSRSRFIGDRRRDVTGFPIYFLRSPDFVAAAIRSRFTESATVV